VKEYEIIVIPHSSLFIGGYAEASGQSDGDTASDRAGLLVPGSAVKGALRESAERLVRGAGAGMHHVDRLFGRGATEERQGTEGRLRIGPLRCEIEGTDGAAAEDLPDPVTRIHVSLDRRLRQAAPERLFQNRVTAAGYGLRFRGVLTVLDPLDAEEEGFLRAVVSITDQVGAGRGRGLGLVSIQVAGPLPERPPAKEPAFEGVTSAVLVLQAMEPLQLAGIKDSSNYTSSRDHLDGSVLRGAVAARLPEEALETVLGGNAPACFGDGRPGGLSSIPAPLTLNQPKGGGALYDEAVVLLAEILTGHRLLRPLDLRRVEGTLCREDGTWVRSQLKRRTITRAARDYATGRVAHGKLFSLEVIDPYLDSEGVRKELLPLRLYVPISGSPEQLRLVVASARKDLYVGGDRNRGLGRLAFVEVKPGHRWPALDERHQRWSDHLGRLGVPRPESTAALLALGPLAVDARRLQAALGELDLKPIHGVMRRQTHGGWSSHLSLPRNVGSHYVPGSVFLVRRSDGSSALPALRRLETEGIGPGRPDGWGWLVACHPIHLDCTKEVPV
jgi:CRISPR/Cas system CSM-associated protein Csm3 (group 7 of RAMP superfamily)